jgi:hypothetical protein
MFLVKTESLYAAILDVGSAANRLGYLTTSLEAGKRKAVRDGLEELFGLFVFNEQLIQAAKDGELLAWTLLFDGVFRAVVQAAPESAQMPPHPSSNLGDGASQATLVCPTGRLIISCLGRLGEVQSPLVVLEPGSYLISLERDEDEEQHHTFLDSVRQYPTGEGPDWKIKIQRVSGNCAGA